MTVSAHVTPESAPRMFPSPGLGAVSNVRPASEEDQRCARSEDQGDGDVRAPQWFAKEEGCEEEHVERRGRLEEDRAGRSRQRVCHHEEDHRRAVGAADEKRSGAEAAPRRHQRGQKECRDPRAEPGDLPARECRQLDDRPARGEEEGCEDEVGARTHRRSFPGRAPDPKRPPRLRRTAVHGDGRKGRLSPEAPRASLPPRALPGEGP